MNAECVFCRIVQGQIPSTRVYEDAGVLAFMDIGPVVQGHVLVIPKAHYDPITDVPAPLLAKIMAVVQKVAAAQMTALHADGVNLFQANGAAAGQVVPHMHIHVIPRFNGDGHRWNWTSRKYEKPGEMERIAAALSAHLSP
jgi:histidine triad (HIT) family protein